MHVRRQHNCFFQTVVGHVYLSVVMLRTLAPTMTCIYLTRPLALGPSQTNQSQGMVDVVSRRCDSPGCKRQPSGTTDATHVQFCSLHRGDGRAGYTLLMLAQRERLAAAAALEEQQKQQRARDRAPASGSWPGKDMPFSDYHPRWEAAGSSGSSGGASFSGGQPTPGTFGSNSSSSGSFLSSQRSAGGGGESGSFTGESFLSTQRRGVDEGAAGSEPGSAGQDGKAAAHNPQPWLWTAQRSSQGGRRPPPIKNPAEAGVLGIAGRQQSPLLDSTRGDSPGAEWTKPSSTQSAHAMYPAVKRHCSPRRRSFSHSPEPGSRTMAGLTGSMAGLQASSPASPNVMSMGASGGTPSPGAMGIPTPPGSSGSAALPPPHRAPRTSAQRLPQFQNRAVPRSSSGGPPRPPRSLSPGGVASTARSPDGFVYALSGTGRSPGSGVGFSPRGGPPSASPGGGISGVFSPGSAVGSVMSGGGGLNSARSSVSSTGPSPRWASPRNRAFGHTRTRSQGSVADTLEDLSIVDPIPPTLEPLRTLPPVAAPLRSPRDRWRAGFLERRNNSDIILPLPDRTQPDPAPGPASDVRRRSFTASLFERQDQMDIKDEGIARPSVPGGSPGGPGSGGGGGGSGGSGGGSANGAMIPASAGEGDRWGAGMWSSPGEGVFQATSAGARQQGWPHQMQNGRTGDESGGGGGGGGHAEAKATRRGSHHSVGTMPLTSSESLGDGDGGSVFFSAEG